jgi:NDP-sugar pyrophosphorylase family protein
MADSPAGSRAGLCAVILAAGAGTRLRPLTTVLPKALCPVGNVPLLDLALDRLARLGLAGPDQIAVNAWYLADQVVEAASGRARLSVETGPTPLGTAGGVGALRDWIDGRAVLVGNADAYLAGAGLDALLDGWDGTGTRLLGVPTTPDDPYRFGRFRFAGYSLLPWHRVVGLPAVPDELVHTVWRPAEAAGELTVVEHLGCYLDTGTPADYLAANLHAIGSAGRLIGAGAEITGTVRDAVIGSGARVAGRVERSVVWPGAQVGPSEHLIEAIRFGESGTVTAKSNQGSKGAPA